MKRYYNHFFKQLAIEDSEIAHNDEEPSFFIVEDMYSPDAFDNAIRSAAKTPALLLEDYRAVNTGYGTSNRFKHIMGRFNILKSIETGDRESIDRAKDDCEAIADALVDKMNQQLRDGYIITIAPGDASKKAFFPAQDVPIDPIGPISTTYYGVTVGFVLRIQR